MDLTRDHLNDLLSWLDPDIEVAARKYQTIQKSLIRIFVSRGFSDPEHLADLTIDRVIEILPRRKDFVGEKARLFYSVARFIMLEEADKREVPVTDLPPASPHKTGTTVTHEEYDCLLQCLNELTLAELELIHDYHVYDGEGRLKIENHEEMKEEHGLEGSSLRVKTNRIRARLREGVLRRMKTLQVKRNAPRLALRESREGVREPTRER